MVGVPVGVVANKQDVRGAMTSDEISDKLGLSVLAQRKWFIQGACAVSGAGLHEAMQQIARLVNDFQKNFRRQY